MSLLPLALVPFLVVASPPPRSHRVSVLLIPMDQGAEARSLQLEGLMNEAMEEFAIVELATADELFGLPAPDKAELALRRADEGHTAGRVSYLAHRYAEAARQLATALEQYQLAAPALHDLTRACDSLLLSAASTFQLGHKEAAAPTLETLDSICPEGAVSDIASAAFNSWNLRRKSKAPTRYPAELTIRSKPLGARVFLDGKQVGFSPLVLSTVRPGRHHLRWERPGFISQGQFVTLPDKGMEVVSELKPTPSYLAYDAILDSLAAEVIRDAPVKSLVGPGKMLGLDRALVGTLKQLDERGTLELICGLYDVAGGGKRLVRKKAVLQGDEFGELKREVARLVSYLVTQADIPHPLGKTSDPLDRRHGTEDWNVEDKKPHSKDPLDTRTGTEDW